MRDYVLDESRFDSVSRFFDAVASEFGFFPDFGRNLDALADCLDDESGLAAIEKPCRVIWKTAADPVLPADFREAVFEIFSSVDGIDFSLE